MMCLNRNATIYYPVYQKGKKTAQKASLYKVLSRIQKQILKHGIQKQHTTMYIKNTKAIQK